MCVRAPVRPRVREEKSSKMPICKGFGTYTKLKSRCGITVPHLKGFVILPMATCYRVLIDP